MSEARPEHPPIVLASASPRRKELLAALLEGFEIVPAEIPEPFSGDPVADALALARAKALAVASSRREAVVIGSDTMVHDDERSYGKPEAADDAVRILRELRGRSHLVTTGVAVVHRDQTEVGSNTTRVEMAALTDAEIAAYVASGRPLDKAGAYAIQDEDVPTVRAYDGCYCGIMGLPLWECRALLLRVGVSCRAPSETYERCLGCPDRPKGG